MPQVKGVRQRAEKRVPLRLPVRVELEEGAAPPAVIEGLAEELSGHGFRLRLESGPLPEWVELDRPYPARLTVGRKAMTTLLEFVWWSGGCCGVRFWQWDRAWPIR
jgi:hypothetical protein